MTIDRTGQTRPLTRWVLLTLLAFFTVTGSASSSQGQTDTKVLRGYYSANGLLNRGMYDLAATEYLKFLDEHSEHEKAAVARYGLAVAYYRMQQYREAAEQAAHLDGLDGFDYAAEARMIRGQSLLALHEYDPAVEQFRFVLDRHADHDLADDAAALATEAMFRGGDNKAAVESARVLVRDWPDSAARERTELFWGLAEMSSDHFPEAAERFGLIMQRYPQGEFADRAALLLAQSLHRSDEFDAARRQYEAVIKRANDAYTPDARYGLGVILHQQDRLDEADEILGAFLERHGEHDLADKAALQRAQVLYDKAQYDEAASLLAALDKKPDARSAETAYWLAKCEMRQGRPEIAAKRLEEALQAFSENDLLAEMMYDRAVALIRAGADDAAMEVLRTFRSRFPANELAAHALHLMAASTHQQKAYEKSRELCELFAAEYEGHELSTDVAFLAAENTYLQGDYEKATSSYERFLRDFATDERAPQARFRLGTALYRAGNRKEAEKYLMSVIGDESRQQEFASAFLSLGDIHFQRGGWTAAEEYLSRYLELIDGEAGADDALLKLGLARERQDRTDEALATYEQLLKRFPKSPQRLHAMFERGQALLKLEQHEAAADAFLAVLEEKSDSRFSSYALSHLAALSTMEKDYAGAAKLYEQAAKTAPHEKVAAEALYQAGVSWMAQREFSRAHTSFTKVLDDHGKHVRVPESFARRAVATARLNDFDKGLKQLEHALEKYDDKLDTELVMLLNYERAWCLRERGDDDAAAKAYRAVLAADSASAVTPHALLELAEIEEKSERYESAVTLLEELREASAVSPDVAEQATYRLGYCNFRLEKYEQATRHFSAFIKSFPGSTLLASASLFCGESLFAQGEHRKAAEHLSRIVEHHADDPTYAASLLRLGECESAMQHWSRSEDVFQTYIENVDDSDLWYQAQFGIGWARENQGQFDEAIDAYKVVLDRHQGPTAARAQFQVGECLYAMGDHADAVRELLKVDILYAYPEWSAAALYEAGRCFEELADPVNAKSQYKQVTERHADTEWASLAERRLVALAATSLPGHGSTDAQNDRESDTR